MRALALFVVMCTLTPVNSAAQSYVSRMAN